MSAKIKKKTHEKSYQSSLGEDIHLPEETLVFKPPPSNFSSTVTVELCWDFDLMNKISQ